LAIESRESAAGATGAAAWREVCTVIRQPRWRMGCRGRGMPRRRTPASGTWTRSRMPAARRRTEPRNRHSQGWRI